MLFHRAHRQKRRNGNVIFVNAAVAQDDDIRAAVIFPLHRHKKLVNRLFKRCVFVIQNGNHRNFESFFVQRLDFQHVHARQNRIVDFKDGAVFALRLQKIAVRTDVNSRIRHDFFAQ